MTILVICVHAKKEAGCRNFAYERDFIVLMIGIRDSDRFLTGCEMSYLPEP